MVFGESAVWVTRDLRECRTLAAFCQHTESRAWPLVEIWPCVTRTNARAHTRIQKHAHRLTPSHTRTAEHCTCTDGNTHSRSHLANPSPSFLRVHKHIHSHSLPRSLTTHARTLHHVTRVCSSVRSLAAGCSSSCSATMNMRGKPWRPFCPVLGLFSFESQASRLLFRTCGLIRLALIA